MNEKRNSDDEKLKLDLNVNEKDLIYLYPAELKHEIMKIKDNKNDFNKLKFIDKLKWKNSEK